MEEAEKTVMTDTYHKTERLTIEMTTGGPEDSLPENSAPAKALCPDLWTKPLNIALPVNSATVRHFSAKALAALFCPQLLDESKCTTWLNTILHGADKRCPQCHAPLDVASADSFIQGKRVTCKACNRWFTARSGTFLQGSQLSDAQVFLMAFLIDAMQTGITPARIAEVLGVSVDTVRLWIKKFKAFEG